MKNRIFHYKTNTVAKYSKVIFGQGTLYSSNFLSLLRKLSHQVVIITDTEVEKNIGKDFHRYLIQEGLITDIFSFPSGEQSKTEETKNNIIQFLYKKKCDQNSCLIALGGGVTTDIGGYVAATFCRGIPLINIPTSLIGMVDAAIGGKTGVNALNIKNLIGCIYQPELILIDPFLLNSLPNAFRKEGYAEILKYAIVLDRSLFAILESQETVDSSITFLEPLILKSCHIKLKVLKDSEKKTGKRDLLNFGHTIGHALESLTGHLLSHGEAVKIGLIVESFISLRIGRLSYIDFHKIACLVLKYGIAEIPGNFTKYDFFELISSDKKSCQRIPRFVNLKAVGRYYQSKSNYCFSVHESVLDEVFCLLKYALYRFPNHEFFENSRNHRADFAPCSIS